MNTESEWKELGATGNPELLGDFIVEAREHLSDIQMRLRSIDPHPGNAPASASCDAEALNAIFRAFHTIKGLAGFLNLSALAQVAHEMETLLAVARTGELVIASEHIEVILAGSRDLARRIDELDTHTSTGQELGAPAPSIRVDTGQLDRLALLVDELSIAASQVRRAPAWHKLTRLGRMTNDIQRTVRSLRPRSLADFSPGRAPKSGYQ